MADASGSAKADPPSSALQVGCALATDEGRERGQPIAPRRTGRSFLLGAVLASLMLVAILMADGRALVDGHWASLLKQPAAMVDRAVKSVPPAIEQVVKAAQPIVAADPDLAAVRAWLKENLNDPQWEEVRWWPAKPFGYSFPDAGLKRTDRVARLKYRTKNPFGALAMRDQVFVFQDGTVNPVESYGWASEYVDQFARKTLSDGDDPAPRVNPDPIRGVLKDLAKGGFTRSASGQGLPPANPTGRASAKLELVSHLDKPEHKDALPQESTFDIVDPTIGDEIKFNKEGHWEFQRGYQLPEENAELTAVRQFLRRYFQNDVVELQWWAPRVIDGRGLTSGKVSAHKLRFVAVLRSPHTNSACPNPPDGSPWRLVKLLARKPQPAAPADDCLCIVDVIFQRTAPLMDKVPENPKWFTESDKRTVRKGVGDRLPVKNKEVDQVRKWIAEHDAGDRVVEIKWWKMRRDPSTGAKYSRMKYLCQGRVWDKTFVHHKDSVEPTNSHSLADDDLKAVTHLGVRPDRP